MSARSTAAVLVAAALLGPPAALAESVSDVGQWNALFATGDLTSAGDRLKWWFDGHYRLFDDTNGFGQSIVRPALGWELEEGAGTVWAGWAWIRTSPVAGDAFDEHRAFQQWTWSKSIGDRGYALRSRLEQRFAEGGDDTAVRFRQLLRAQKTIRRCPPLTFVVWDELFVNLNDADWGPRGGFDQNRLFVGVGLKRSPSAEWRTEIGYLNQAINAPGGTDRVNHILSVNFYR